MTIFLLVLLIGIVSGLRAMMAPAAITWAAHFGWLALAGTPLAFLGQRWAPAIATVFALVELITDQLPTTPSRTAPVQFGTRILAGGLSGAAIALAAGVPATGVALGILGAVIGTLGGRWGRGRLAAHFGRDRPAAFIEDVVAIALALLIVGMLA